ncbi:12265_t:CDS:10 [Entrophospora sp. SA101]|nr:12265_t:CDS:10 [Entrophospora sp. SA101]
MNSNLDKSLFQLKFTAKQLSRQAKKASKDETAEKTKLKKAIEQGNIEGARIYAANAIRKKNESLNLLRLSSRIDAVSSRVQTAVTMQKVTGSMAGVVKGMDKAMESMNLEKISMVMDKFESQFEDLDVQTQYMESAIGNSTAMTTPQDEVDLLMQKVADEHGLELNQRLGEAVPSNIIGEETTKEDEELTQRLRIKILIEKHWRGVINRQLVDYFNDYAMKQTSSEDLLPIISTPKYQLVHIYRSSLTFLSPVSNEVDALLVLEFLHRIADIFTEYFGDLSELSIKDNFDIVYQLLEEMMDYGYPLTTEPNALREMIAPPNIINKVISQVAGVTSVVQHVPNGSTISSIPWRKAGVKYTNNEIYFDIIEEIDAIIDSNGAIVSSEVHGVIQSNCRLSGMPDLTLSFVNPKVLDDCSFHPCVRYKKFESERILSFVPPDEHFKLMSYRVNLPYHQSLPIHVKPQFHLTDHGGKFDITINVRNTDDKSIENVLLVIPLAKSVTNVNATCNLGSYIFDPVTKCIKWDLGKIMPKDRTPMLSGNFSSIEQIVESGHTIILDFQISMYAISGLKVDTLKVFNESYKPYKKEQLIYALEYRT